MGGVLAFLSQNNLSFEQLSRIECGFSGIAATGFSGIDWTNQ